MAPFLISLLPAAWRTNSLLNFSKLSGVSLFKILQQQQQQTKNNSILTNYVILFHSESFFENVVIKLELKKRSKNSLQYP